jgi:hypothetical protein
VKRGSPVSVPLLALSELVGIAGSVDEGVADSELWRGCLPGCETWKYVDFSMKGSDEGFTVCVTVMKTVGGGGAAEGATVATDSDECSGVLGESEVVFARRSEEVFGAGVSVIVDGGAQTISGPMGRPVMVMLAQGVWVLVLDSSVTIVVTVIIGVRQAISSESLPLFPKVGEAPTVCCVPYLVESVVLDIVLLG